MKLRFPRLTQSVKLKLWAFLGLVWPSPFFWLGFQLPMFRDWPLWLELAMTAGCYVATWAWFLQCRSPDKSRFIPKWW